MRSSIRAALVVLQWPSVGWSDTLQGSQRPDAPSVVRAYVARFRTPVRRSVCPAKASMAAETTGDWQQRSRGSAGERRAFLSRFRKLALARRHRRTWAARATNADRDNGLGNAANHIADQV